jgi:dienelactone hydrolase
MPEVYRRWMHAWEARLCSRATDRVVRPFEWGLEWTRDWPSTGVRERNGHSDEAWLRLLSQQAIEHSDEFFGYRTPSDFTLTGPELRFTSPIHTPFPENNTVRAHWFPAKPTVFEPKPGKKAVIVLPHWNAHAAQHVALSRGISLLGISALRLSLPYHDLRMPPETKRADYAVSSNVARTIDATRQAVIDIRSCLDWFQQQGYEKLGIVGTSLGSAYAFLASAHDDRLAVNVFNHCSTQFADVVWTGLSTQHIRQSLEPALDLERARAVWAAITPTSYIQRFAQKRKKSLLIYGKYDTTFLPEYSKEVVLGFEELGLDHKVAALPCGHYTMGLSPFKFLDGYHICAFLKQNL